MIKDSSKHNNKLTQLKYKIQYFASVCVYMCVFTCMCACMCVHVAQLNPGTYNLCGTNIPGNTDPAGV